MCGVGRFVRIEALHARYSAASQSKWKDAPVIVGYGDGDDGVAYVTYEFRCSKPPTWRRRLVSVRTLPPPSSLCEESSEDGQ